MHFALVAIRALLAATVLCSVAAAWPVAFGPEGRELLELDSNRWSGLLGLLLGGSAAVAALGAIAPQWVLTHPAAVAFAALPFVSSLLVRFSDFDNTAMLSWALAATLFAGLAALALLATAFLARDRRRVPARSSA